MTINDSGRLETRMPIEILMTVSPLTTPYRRFYVLTKNFSVSGCMFECSENFEPNQHLRIETAGGMKRIDLLARVAYVDRVQDDNYKVGIKFLSLNSGQVEAITDIVKPLYLRGSRQAADSQDFSSKMDDS